MSAQFDYLNTGNTGVTETFGNEDISPIVDEAIAEQRREAQELLPSIKAILATLDEEITAVADIRSYIKALGSQADWDAISSEYRARELYIEMIGRLKQSIANKVADYEADNG